MRLLNKRKNKHFYYHMSFIPFAFVRKNPLTRIHFITLWISQFRGISSAQLKQYVTGFDIRIENTTHPKVENHCWFLGRSHKIHDSKVGACACVWKTIPTKLWHRNDQRKLVFDSMKIFLSDESAKLFTCCSK